MKICSFVIWFHFQVHCWFIIFSHNACTGLNRAQMQIEKSERQFTVVQMHHTIFFAFLTHSEQNIAFFHSLNAEQFIASHNIRTYTWSIPKDLTVEKSAQCTAVTIPMTSREITSTRRRSERKLNSHRLRNGEFWRTSASSRLPSWSSSRLFRWVALITWLHERHQL